MQRFIFDEKPVVWPAKAQSKGGKAEPNEVFGGLQGSVDRQTYRHFKTLSDSGKIKPAYGSKTLFPEAIGKNEYDKISVNAVHLHSLTQSIGM